MSTPSATADATLPATARAVLVALLTFGLCLLARAVSGGQALSLLLWPALGVAFAFGWRWGHLWTLPAAIGALAYGLTVFDSPTPAVATAIGTALGAVASIDATLGAELVRQAVLELTDGIGAGAISLDCP